MDMKLKTSIDRAIALLGTKPDYSELVCVKITPEAGCCCFHCWPYTWEEVNRAIQPFGPIEDEGNVLIETKDGGFVLECHESGPEIVFYAGAVTAGVLLVKAVIELVTTIIKSRSSEPRRRTGNLTITKKTFKGSRLHEETIIEINLPLESHHEEILTHELRKALDTKGKPNKCVNPTR